MKHGGHVSGIAWDNLTVDCARARSISFLIAAAQAVDFVIKLLSLFRAQGRGIRIKLFQCESIRAGGLSKRREGGIRVGAKIVHDRVGGLAAAQPWGGAGKEGGHNYSAVHAIDPTRVT